MQNLLQDLRFTLRQLRKSPGFTLTVVLTLALGLGANAAVFTLFDQVLLRMLPVQRPQELVRFVWTGPFNGSVSSFGGDISNYFSYPMFQDLRDQNQVFTGILAADRANVGVAWHNQAEDEDAEVVSGNYFQLLGLKPVAGRLLIPQDDTVKGGNPVLVLGYSYWKTRFAASRTVIGQTMLVNGHPFIVLGVAPENFHSAIGGYKPGLFLPLSMSEVAMPGTVSRDNRNNHQSVWLTLVARRKPGITVERAQAGVSPLWHALRARELPLYTSSSDRFKQRYLESKLQVKDDSTGFSPGRIALKTPLILLMSMAGLLVAMCAINVATLLLLRAAGRAREMSMRYALGAMRGRVMAQLLVEGGLLGAIGAAAGLALAPVVAATLVHLLTTSNPGEEPYSAAMDARVLLFTIALSLAASVLFSVAPVLHFMRPDLAVALRQNAGTSSRASQTFRKVAVGAQIALSVVLLGCAGLFVRTLDNLRHQPVGFQTGDLACFSLDPTASGYGEDRAARIMQNAIAALRQVPGVTGAAASNDPVLAGNQSTNDFRVQGHNAAEDESINFESPSITPGYFATMRQPLLVGREFTRADSRGKPRVAIVNLAMAKRYFGSPQDALGRLLSDGGPKDPATITIVGVAGDIKHFDLRTASGPAVYTPYLQDAHPGGAEIYVQTAQAPAAAEAAIRKAIHDLDPALVVDNLLTMEEQMDRSAADERAVALLAAGFALLAMVLASVGLYGVLAYSTGQRTREFGVRLALGAPRHGVMGLVVREMAVIAAIATAVALPSIVMLARLFRSQLYGVTAADPVTLLAAVALTAVMVLLAATLPARRAASIGPMEALRTE